MISAFLTALAGTFYTQYIYFIDPATAFSFNISIEAALVSIVGGIGTLWGPVIGTVLLETTSALLQSWLGSSTGGIQLTVYALILMAVILWRPTGLMGLINEAMQRRRDRQPATPEDRAMTDALVIKGLSKRFGGLRAVQDVSFTVKENETVALIGPNGAGKTTSFHLITGFHRADSGSVLAFGQEIVGLKPHDVCALGLARTFQVAKPFGAMTVLANVMTGAFLRDRHVAAAREKAREAIDFVGLSARAEHGGQGPHHHRPAPAGDGARAGDPAEDPAARRGDGRPQPGRDRPGGGAGRQAFRARAHHRHRRARDARDHGGRAHIVVLDHGQKIAEGAPKEIVENPEVIRAYLGSYVHTPPAEARMLKLSGVSARLRLGACDHQCLDRDRRRRSRRPARRQRRGQEHDAARDLGAGEAHRRAPSPLPAPISSSLPPYRIPELGIAHVPEGRQVFPEMTVQENLEIGAFVPKAKAERAQTMELVYGIFPRLADRRKQLAGTMSGGEQQMLAVGRGLMLKPRLLMLDEPSLGLAPVMTDVTFEKIGEIHKMGTAILLVEQNVSRALSLVQRAYVLESGNVIMHGSSDELANNKQVQAAYLGI